MGTVSPVGVGLDAYIRALRDGVSGVRFYDPGDPRCRSRAAALCEGFDPERVLSRAELARVPRIVPMALAAAREACDRAGLAPLDEPSGGLESERYGVVLGTGGGGIDFTLDQATRARDGARPSLWTITNATHGNLAGELSIRLGLRGPSLCVSNGCSSGSDALGLAMDLVRSDRPGSPDGMVVVAADAHVRFETLLSMELLGVVTTRSWTPTDAPTASRPFDASRDGFVLGEGAWAIVIERPDAARRRDVPPLGEALGYGSTCDAHHRVRPAPDMQDSARAIVDAIRDAGLDAASIDAVQMHGTATRLNDELETRAIRLAFDAHADRLLCSSIKSMIGHPQGASGLASVVAMVGSLGGLDGGPAFIPPTINLHDQDPACDLNLTRLEARQTDARTALVNCLAFGAKNSALVLRARPQ